MSPRLDRLRRAEDRLWSNLGVTPVEHRVELPSGGAVRIQEVGEGPPVLFVHGGSVAGTSWSGLAASLPGFRCLLLDRPGCGLSDPIPGGPLTTLAQVAAHADRLVPDVLDALGLARAAVVATSYGGYFALRGAAAAPERVERIIELSWAIGAPSAGAPLPLRLGSLPGVRRLPGHLPITPRLARTMLRQIGLRRAVDTGTFDDDMVEWFVALLRGTDTLRNDLRSSPDVVTPIRGVNRAVLLGDDLLARVTMPVLFLWGDEDPNGGVEVGRRFAARLPDARFQVVPAAGHAPWIDEPELCAREAGAFLRA